MHWILQLAFLAVHLLLYVVILRRLAILRKERKVFGYHAWAFAIIVIATLLAWHLNAITPAAVVGMLSLQLIYSMTFLEAWSLAQGSYSLQILLGATEYPSRSKAEMMAAAESIGTLKKGERLRSLIRLHLVKDCGASEVRLTGAGRCVTAALRTVKFFANIHSAG